VIVRMAIIGKKLILTLAAINQRDILLSDLEGGDDVVLNLVDEEVGFVQLSLQIAPLFLRGELFLTGRVDMHLHGCCADIILD
jgi:hypothetical protein